MDASVMAKVLQDPKVQEAVRKAGVDAMSNPKVQIAILEACRRRFPEAAGLAQSKVREWANDPEVQRQAYYYAGVTMDYAWHAVEEVVELIEQGPSGVRFLAILGGVACCAQAVLEMLGVLNPISALTKMVTYTLHTYQVSFALTSMLFEVSPGWVEMVPRLDEYQNLLLEKANFLSEVLGRGLFYAFQGTLWFSFATADAPQNYVLGLYFLFMAALYVCMHFDVLPKEAVAKVLAARELGASNVVIIDNTAAAVSSKEPLLYDEAPPPIQAQHRRPPCKHGGQCIQDAMEHRQQYAHPGDWDWDVEDKLFPQDDLLFSKKVPNAGPRPHMPGEGDQANGRIPMSPHGSGGPSPDGKPKAPRAGAAGEACCAMQ